MVNFYKMASKSRKLEEISEPEKGCWINLENPSDKEIELICKSANVPEELIKAALDEEERARIQAEDNNILILFDIPMTESQKDWYIYSTLPMGIILNDDYVITVCLKSTAILNDFIDGRVKNFDINKHSRFLYQILYNNAIKFLHYLRQIDKSSNKVQQSLHRSMKNKELIQLLDLEKALVYFSTSLNANELVFNKIFTAGFIKRYEDDKEILEDVIIENRQAIEMCTIYRDILSGTMDAYASVISNNQNIVMKFLTAITFIMAIPTMIASFFGMNVPIPMQNFKWGFAIIVAVSILLVGISLIVMIRRKMF